MLAAVDLEMAPESRPSRVGGAVLWITTFVLLFVSLGVRQLWKSEDRWAEAAREMLLWGDYFHPRINGTVYFDKPVLGYWLIALTAKLVGRLNEWTVRLPSALAGLAAL